MKKIKIRKNVQFRTVIFVLAAAAGIGVINSCNKDKATNPKSPVTVVSRQAEMPSSPDRQLTQELSIANLRLSADATPSVVLFNENAEVFHVQDAGLLTTLKNAFADKIKVKVTFDPWQGKILQVAAVESKSRTSGIMQINKDKGQVTSMSGMSAESLDSPERIGVINTTAPGLTNVIPDMATAQLMFNYLAKQCCKIPGPYDIDYCISFQYAEDGCYARAHKMCYILNTKYHYSTHKVFSFANSGSDVLSVKAEKWGGCCVTWWYHVAPLVNIKTAAGTKAYVFDPAMFDQPVLLSAWLHGQENPDCAYGAHVSMINVQPTSSYWPSDGSGYYFGTDPTFSSTNSTLESYSTLATCY